MEIDIGRVCRSCLSENSETYYQINESAKCHNESRFDWRDLDLTIADVIMACTVVQIHPGDGLPQAVCMECLHQVQQAFGFKQICEATDDKLRKFAPNVKNENEECSTDLISEPETIHVREISVMEQSDNELDDEIKNESNVPDCSDGFDNDSNLCQEPMEKKTSVTEKIDTINVEEVRLKDIDENTLMEQTQIINGRYKCVICTKSLGARKSYRLHLRLHIGKNLRRCNVCERGFAKKSHLDRHLLTHKKIVKCNNGHESKCSQAQQSFNCDQCPKTFYQDEQLKAHKKDHLLPKKVFGCNVCRKQFSRMDNLRSHMQRHIPAEKRKDVQLARHLCSYCGASFTNSSNLTVHIRRHTGYMPFKCETCDRRFPRSCDLICHRRTHTGEKPFVCDCGKAFCRSGQLVRHMRIHTGEKPYKCSHEHCDKSFTQLNDLKLHGRRHTGEKPFVCNCGKRFITNSLLKQHRKSQGHEDRAIGETTVNCNHINIQADQKLTKSDGDMATYTLPYNEQEPK